MKIHWAFIVAVVLGVALDLWTKNWAFTAFPAHGYQNIVVIPGWVEITNIRNSGMAWSLFQNVSPIVWIAVRGLLTLALMLLWHRNASHGFWLNAAFAAVIAGALGNLHDNIFAEDGHVRDFVSVILGTWRFPIFNVADSLITCGAPILVFGVSKLAPEESAANPETRS